MKRVQPDVFDGFVQWLLAAEGAHDDNPADRGGETHFGLSARFLASIGWKGGPPTQAQAIDIYREHFWRGWRCHEMHPFVAWCACDAYVQHPSKAATMMLQQGLGVDPDGISGPMTLDAARSPNLTAFWRRYRLARIRYYCDIVANDPTQSVFSVGWQDRLHKLAEGILFSGIVQSDPSAPGTLRAAVQSPGAKAAGFGGIAALLVGALQWAGWSPDTVGEWLTNIGAPSGLAAIAAAWLSRIRLKGD